MKKIFILLPSLFLLAGCVESIALLGPATTAVSGGNIVQSSITSAVNFGVKKTTGKSPMQHALAYAEEKNPNKEKKPCISSIEKTNSEICMIVKKQILLSKNSIKKKIFSTQTNVNEKAQADSSKNFEVKHEVNSSIKPNNLVDSKKSPIKFVLAIKTKIKEYDARWLTRIEDSRTFRPY